MKKVNVNQLTPGPSLREERGDRPKLGRRGESISFDERNILSDSACNLPEILK